MFKLEENNKKIGLYLSELISKNGQNQRQFCKDYLNEIGVEENNEEVQKMQNRLSQIIKGNKAIQTYDLPIFTKLLNVSCEEILSAGKFFAPKLNRLTNYSVAFSDDEKVWETYINHPDELILKMDEYGKTVIEYAFEFKNSKFLNYLIDKKYICFNKEGGFSATSSIESNLDEYYGKPSNRYLSFQLSNIKFREKIINLAISENNLLLLEQMHAREIPEFYYLTTSLDIADEVCEYYEEEINKNLVNSDESILKYFTDEIEISSKYKTNIKVLYFYISDLLDCLVKKNHKFTEIALKKAIAHSNNTYNKLKNIIEKALEKENSRLDCLKEEFAEKERVRSINFIFSRVYTNEENNLIEFSNYGLRENYTTNIAYVSEISKDEKINKLIEELNNWYGKIINIKDEYTKESDFND